jgi:hypothetical protein
MVREGLEGGASPLFSRKFTFAQGKALEGPGAGAGPHRVAANPRGSPHKPRKGRRGERGLPGVERYAAGGSPGGGRTWESDPPPEDPLRPPLRGLEGPGRGGVVEKRLPPHTPRLLGPLRAGPRGGDSGILPSWTAKMADLRGAGHPPPKPQSPHRFGPQLASQVPGEGKNPGELAKVPGPGKKTRIWLMARLTLQFGRKSLRQPRSSALVMKSLPDFLRRPALLWRRSRKTSARPARWPPYAMHCCRSSSAGRFG